MLSRQSRPYRLLLPAALLFAASVLSARAAAPVLRIQVRDGADGARLTIASTVPLSFSYDAQPSLLTVTFQTRTSFRILREPFQSRFIRSLGWSRGSESLTMAVSTAIEPYIYVDNLKPDPFELTIDIRPGRPGTPSGAAAPSAASVTPAAGASGAGAVPSPAVGTVTAPVSTAPAAAGAGSIAPTAPGTAAPAAAPLSEGGAGRRTRKIVLDPGHGGLEVGAKGSFGTMEKDVTLAICRKLKTALEKGLSSQVSLTREGDEDVPLDKRAAVANNIKADLFISVHTNGSRRKLAQGSETFFMSLTATDEETRKLAYLENEASRLKGTIADESRDDIQLILWDMAQTAFIKQSGGLAEIIQAELNDLLGTKDRGVKQAPFKVLTGVACPAVLVEVAFISNPDEEKRLTDEKFQDTVVAAVYRGLVKFLKVQG